MPTMLRRAHWAALTPLLLGLACNWDTELCACSPSRSAVFVIGTVTDAGLAPVVGARVYLRGVRPGSPAVPTRYLLSDTPGVTDASGAFRTRAYDDCAATTAELRAAILVPGRADTVVVSAGSAPFRDELGRVDTVHVALRVP